MRRLSTRLTVVLGVLLAMITAFSVMVTVHAMRVHMLAVDQSLHQNLAGEVLKAYLPEIRTNLASGQDMPAFQQLMTINPKAEFYILDAQGRVMSYAPPRKPMLLERVDLRPIHELLAGDRLPILGDDPRNPGEQRTFSAAPVEFDAIRVGYVYVVLGGDAYQSAAALFEASHILRLTLGSLLGASVAAFIAGAIAFQMLSGRLASLASAMLAFDSSGFRDPPAQLATSGRGDEIDELTRVYSAMVNRIASQITELERADASRREVFTHISHDLRTPLASLQAYLETLTLKSEELSAEARTSYLEAALAFSRKIDHMTADLFELATLDLHEVPMRPERFSLAELLQDIGQRFGLQASNKGLLLDVAVAAPGAILEADIGLIERLFANLIDNAIKFTPAGGKVSVTLEKDSRFVIVRVRDTGIGIPTDQIDRIFERFYRVTSLTPGVDGTGLGLAIAKRIVELHRGQIDVESNLGQGTTFVLRLPTVA